MSSPPQPQVVEPLAIGHLVDGRFVAGDPEPVAAVLDCEAPAGPRTSQRSSASRSSSGSGRPFKYDANFEYEDVLLNFERRFVDRLDFLARRCCPFKRCCDSLCTDKVKSYSTGKRYSSWEGMREDVPERYQRWEGIRERNVISGAVFGLLGHGRKQPTRSERLHLFMLYAAVWLFCYGFMLSQRGKACRRAWVETCVPRDLGGLCTEGCASSSVLDRTPRDFSDYAFVRATAMTSLDTLQAACVDSGSVASPCDVPLCTERGGDPCLLRRSNASGFCTCNDFVSLFIFEFVVYTVLFKLLYLPFWYIFVRDLDACPRMKCVAMGIVVFLYVALTLLGLVSIYAYARGWAQFGMELLWWLFTFLGLCLFELVKSFAMGMLVGSYVIRPCCPSIARVWKFLFA